MRLIDADALMEELYKAKEENEEARMVLIDNDFEMLINDAPTIDAVEALVKQGYNVTLEYDARVTPSSHTDLVNVVRCKDCKHWRGELIETSIGNLRICAGWELRTDENDYCGYAERRED